MRTERDGDLRDDQEGPAIRGRGLVRRLAVKLAGDLWSLLGFRGAYGEDEVFPDVEAFQGIGFRSKPKAGSAGAEVIVVSVGGQSGHPVIVASRDRSIEVELADDETAIFNSTGAKVQIMADGSIVVRAAAGKTVSVDDGSGSVALARKSDVDELRTKFNTHVHATTPNGPAVVPTVQASVMVGTSVLKGK